MNRLLLSGCGSTPLASYLTALGVLRLVAMQKDPAARGRWVGHRLELATSLDEDALVRFFVEEYSPTPILGPWNGGSGFYPKDNRVAVDAIVDSPAPRLAAYRQALERARVVLSALGIDEKVGKEGKAQLLEACRATLPDSALEWLDAVFVLTEGGPKFPPLLGTGGNDGRLDFTNNFMQRLLELLDPATGTPRLRSAERIRALLFGLPYDGATSGPIGQFSPLAAGGANSGAGFDGDSAINPWGFVLMLEGATLFAAASVRRLEDHGDPLLSAPFTVRPVGAGYASAATDEESATRAEIWLPLWDGEASLAEVRAVLGEGRAMVGGRAAGSGLDFARAVAALGVDRGVSEFERYGFHVRNGLSYFATPLGRFEVGYRPRTRLVDELDERLQQIRQEARRDLAPASATRAVQQIETAIMGLCRHGRRDDLLEVLLALGRFERVLSTSRKWADERRIVPLPLLSAEWIDEVDDGTVEFRIAKALAWSASALDPEPASHAGRRRTWLPLRAQMEAVTLWPGTKFVNWADDDLDVTWRSGDLVSSMLEVLRRRLVRAVQGGASSYAVSAPQTSSLQDLDAFLSGEVDDGRIDDLLWGLVLVDGRQGGADRPWSAPAADSPTETRRMPSALHVLLRLCFAGYPVRETSVPIVAEIIRRAMTGDGGEATVLAVRRLRASGLVPIVQEIPAQGDAVRRAAAALLLPVSRFHLERMANRILVRAVQENQPAGDDQR